MNFRRFVWLFAAGMGLTTPALAQPAQAPTGFALQQADPAPAGDTFFIVPSARAKGLLGVHAMAVANYARRPLRFVAGSRDYITDQLYANLDVSVALAEGILANLDLPYAVVQSGGGDYDRDAEGGIGDLRAGLRWVGHSTPEHNMDAALQLDFWFPTGDQDKLTGDQKVRFNPKLIVGGTTKYFAYSANAGFLFRPHRDLGDGEVGKAITFGAGFAGVLFDQSLQVGPEIYGNTVIAEDGSESPFLGRNSSPVEALLGAKLRLGEIVVGLGVGRGLTRAPGTAQLRGIFSLAYTMDDRIFDSDGDGLADEEDRCPMSPGYLDSGCPPPDRDGDTIVDPDDACPDKPGLVHIDPSKNGCGA